MWHHQRLSFTQGNAQQQLTQRCRPHATVATWREEKGPQVSQGSSLHSDAGNLGGARYTEVKSTYGSLGTGSRPIWMGWDPHNPQTLHLGSHIHSLQGDPISSDPMPGVTHPQSLRWPHLRRSPTRGNTSSLQGDPPHRPCTWGHTSTDSRVTPLTDPAPGVTHPQPPEWPPSPDPVPGVARPLVRTPGLCWLGPYGGNDWVPVTSWLGRQECRWVSFPHTCPRDVLFLFGSAWY